MVTEFGPLPVNDTNKDSTFNCHHPAAGNINFRVVLSNGTDVTRQTNSGIIHNNCFQNGLRYTVTIPGQPQYYKAQVHCLLVSDARLESPPAFTLTKTSSKLYIISTLYHWSHRDQYNQPPLIQCMLCVVLLSNYSLYMYVPSWWFCLATATSIYLTFLVVLIA